MKKEILRHEEYEDGTYVKVEKITQTPEDGFVRREQFGRKGRPMYCKGHSTTITYENNDPKLVWPLMILGFLLFALLCIGFFAIVLAVAKDDPEAVEGLKRARTGALIIWAICFVMTMVELWKSQKKRAAKKKDSTPSPEDGGDIDHME